jgi:hypothetical protein
VEGVSAWKRFLGVGCSHGYLADPAALDAILRVKAAWKPHTTVHLGDCFDTTAFRSGANGTPDESKPVRPDLDSGLQFLRDLRPQIFLAGNHEDRLWRLRSSNNAIVAELSTQIVANIETVCDGMKCKVVPWSYKQGVFLGGWRFCHGTIFSEFAARDMAEVCGNVIFAHAHRAAIATGRRTDAPTGICVGHLMQPELAEYAKARKSTYAWSQGFVWGEYTDSKLVAWLHVQPQGQTTWRLPI